MTPGFCPCRCPRWNTLPVDLINDKLADAPEAPTKSIGSPAPTFLSFSWGLTSGPTPVLAPISASGSAPIVGQYTDKDLQRATKFALESFLQGPKHGQAQAAAALALAPTPTHLEPRKYPLKARFPKLYLGNSHLAYYKCCQQYENHFNIA